MVGCVPWSLNFSSNLPGRGNQYFPQLILCPNWRNKFAHRLCGKHLNQFIIDLLVELLYNDVDRSDRSTQLTSWAGNGWSITRNKSCLDIKTAGHRSVVFLITSKEVI
jgi:hypothetical protein